MNAPARSQEWLDANQQALAGELAALRRRVEGDLTSRPDPFAIPTLARIADAFSLSHFEAEILLLAAGFELDAGIAAQFGPGRTPGAFPTFGQALGLFHDPHWSASSPAEPLRRWALIDFDTEAGVTSGRLRIAESVLHALVGVETLDEGFAGLLRPVAAPEPPYHEMEPDLAALATHWLRRFDAKGEWPPLELIGDDPAELEGAAAQLCARAGMKLFVVSAGDLPQTPHALTHLLQRLHRDLALCEGCLLVRATEESRNLPLIAETIERGPIFAARAAQRSWRRRRPRSLTLAWPSGPERRRLWAQATAGIDLPREMVERAMGQFHLGPAALRAVARNLRDEATEVEDEVSRGNMLWKACQTESSAAISDLADAAPLGAGWDDLVLPAEQTALLRALAAQARHRSKVYDEWGFGAKSGRGLGAAALFAGPSGTGKTLAAEVLAGALDLALWRIDLSQVVSKWIGETEKNLARVFDAASAGGAVLLFDEADALFGKRSEVKDSHDRYANLEVSFLLQRMENYRGLAILTTNNEDALDKAFVRRLRTIVQFPFPDAKAREGVWRRVFPASAPLENLRYDKLARLQLSGGAIRNVALTAAFLAAEARRPIEMSLLREAARIECAKMKQPLSASETEDWETP